ncbi:MAG: flagellar biosynthesis repressor FlbT [Pseudomonadota bacterium]
MALKLSLKPSERFVVNGAVMANGDRRSVLTVENRAAILRERDLMQEEEADTPARRVYFALMCAYLDPEQREDYLPQFSDLMAAFLDAILNPEARELCLAASEAVLKGDFYAALAKLKRLIAYEDGVLNAVREAEACR